MDDEDIQTNFNEIFTEVDSIMEQEQEIEFEFEELESLIYSITYDKWYIHYIDEEEGNEVEEFFSNEEIAKMDSLKIDTVILSKEQIKECMDTAYSYKQEK